MTGEKFEKLESEKNKNLVEKNPMLQSAVRIWIQVAMKMQRSMLTRLEVHAYAMKMQRSMRQTGSVQQTGHGSLVGAAPELLREIQTFLAEANTALQKLQSAEALKKMHSSCLAETKKGNDGHCNLDLEPEWVVTKEFSDGSVIEENRSAFEMLGIPFPAGKNDGADRWNAKCLFFHDNVTVTEYFFMSFSEYTFKVVAYIPETASRGNKRIGKKGALRSSVSLS